MQFMSGKGQLKLLYYTIHYIDQGNFRIKNIYSVTFLQSLIFVDLAIKL